MAVPRRRHSNTKTNQRRSHDALKPRSRSICPRCNSEKLPHRVCGNCGYYKDVRKQEVEGF